MNKHSKTLIHQHWDVVVVGTGMGGATLGYALAKAGKKVLFCEKGFSHIHSDQALCGDYAESFFPQPAAPGSKHKKILAQAGRFTGLINDQSGTQDRSYIPFIGSGSGGSSALFGMAMERFDVGDFEQGKNYQPDTGNNLPESWPISYDQLKPYYRAAEQLFRVRGTLDPLRNDIDAELLPVPPALTAPNYELFEFLVAKGLHPYHLPLACEFVENCKGCQGFLCDKNCKNDSAKICLLPAINQFGAQLIDNCKVQKLLSDGDHVTELVCEIENIECRIKADLVVLAAGALETPRLLLASKSEQWPNGLANNSGLVGKNLMRHCIDLYVFSTKARVQDLNTKEIAFNDFYVKDGVKLGSVQSFGSLPPASILVESIQQELKDKGLKVAAWMFQLFKPVMRLLFSRLFSNKLILVSIMEDFPNHENQVRLSEKEADIVIEYHLNKHDVSRVEKFRNCMKELLKAYRPMLLKQAENTDRVAHACGTCCFGHDAEKSVLNASNRAHHVSNLYIVDSSFFPSSAGTNPSLTIAANALRVAEIILAK